MKSLLYEIIIVNFFNTSLIFTPEVFYVKTYMGQEGQGLSPWIMIYHEILLQNMCFIILINTFLVPE